VAGLDTAELEGLADWATEQLRPDLTLLLDVEPAESPDGPPADAAWRMRGLLAEWAAADPENYVVVDAEGTPDDVAERVRAAVLPVLDGRGMRTEEPAQQEPVEAGSPS
ncbi:MAG: dTMP kinase, partial [Thermocrispum sp.]